MNKKLIALGSDHGGFKAKEELKTYLLSLNYEVKDFGCLSEDSVNYAEFGEKTARFVASNDCFGIVICSSGEGIMMAANKVSGIRCGIGYNDDVAKLLRQHNNANMISFGAKFISIADIKKRSIIFLNTEFEGGRHQIRVDFLNKIK